MYKAKVCILFSRACIANRKTIEQRVDETKLFHSQALALRNPHALTWIGNAAQEVWKGSEGEESKWSFRNLHHTPTDANSNAIVNLQIKCMILIPYLSFPRKVNMMVVGLQQCDHISFFDLLATQVIVSGKHYNNTFREKHTKHEIGAPQM